MECYWEARSEVYNAAGWERTVWFLCTDEPGHEPVLERTRHTFRIPELTAHYTGQGWILVSAP